jgi:hypothetical protein
LAKSRFAGSFLFFSIIPIFPVYFGLKALGLDPPPASAVTYGVALVIYAFALVALWWQKRAYDEWYSELTARSVGGG